MLDRKLLGKYISICESPGGNTLKNILAFILHQLFFHWETFKVLILKHTLEPWFQVNSVIPVRCEPQF